MIEFTLPDRDVAKLWNLLGHFRKGVVATNVDITQASVLFGWWVQKDRAPRTGCAVYGITTPADRRTDVPWAVIPAPHVGDRDWAVAFLRQHWVPEVEAFLEYDALSAIVGARVDQLPLPTLPRPPIVPDHEDDS